MQVFGNFEKKLESARPDSSFFFEISKNLHAYNYILVKVSIMPPHQKHVPIMLKIMPAYKSTNPTVIIQC